MTHNAHCNSDALTSVAYSAKLLVSTKVFVNLLSHFSTVLLLDHFVATLSCCVQIMFVRDASCHMLHHGVEHSK